MDGTSPGGGGPLPSNASAHSENEDTTPKVETVLVKLGNYLCYDLLPLSSKLIVLDKTLLVKKALNALAQHELSYEAAVEEFNNLSIQGLRACKRWWIERMDARAIVSVISQFKILRFIANNLGKVNESAMTVEELGLGITGIDRIATASASTLLVDILNLFVTKHVSAVPIVDETGKLLDVYERYDVFALAKDGGFCDVRIPINEALSKRSQDFEGIHTCAMTDTLGDLLEAIKHMTVHRFIIIDADRRLLGIISLSDILKLLANKYSNA
ncbi:hypothetical protein BC829DRAFT_384714 [Chytridium lagenaria]|nr:hypothetical protein BC829DRAFT_384714 [Chytridium lagenaria]